MPERMCIVTREVRDEAELLRFARAPDGTVVPDLARKLPGRGVWVSLSREKLAEAVRKGLFARGFQAASTADGELPGRVAGLLRQQIVSHLSLARKAGEAVAGATKVEEVLRKGRAGLLFHAAEARPDGVRKLNRLAGPGVQVSNVLAGADLDLAFGRANVVHAAVTEGGLAARITSHVMRYSRYEGLVLGPDGPEDGL